MDNVYIKIYPSIPNTWAGSVLEWRKYCDDLINFGFAAGELHIPDNPLKVTVARINDSMYLDYNIEVHFDHTVIFQPKIDLTNPHEDYSDIIKDDEDNSLYDVAYTLKIVSAICIITSVIRIINYYTWWPIFLDWLKDVLSCLP